MNSFPPIRQYWPAVTPFELLEVKVNLAVAPMVPVLLPSTLLYCIVFSYRSKSRFVPPA